MSDVIDGEFDAETQELIRQLREMKEEVAQASEDQKLRQYLLFARYFATPYWNNAYQDWLRYRFATRNNSMPSAFKFWLGRCWAWLTRGDNPYAVWPGRFNDFLAKAITGDLYGVDIKPGVEWRKRQCQKRARELGVVLDGPLYPEVRRSVRKRKVVEK